MENRLRYSLPATCFEEALPLGNGSVGAMVYGKPDVDKISLNHDTLWSGKPKRVKKEGAYDAYIKSQALVLSGKVEEAEALIEKEFTSDFSQTYMPLGNLYIRSECEGEISDYYRELDFETAAVNVRYKQNRIAFNRKYIVSHPDNCVAIFLSSDAPSSYTFSADSQLKSITTAYQNMLFLTGEAPSNMPATDYTKTSPIEYDGSGIKFAAIGAVKTNGSISFERSELTVKDATEVYFTMCIETSFVSFDSLPVKDHYYPCRSRVERLSEVRFSEILKRHTEDHSSLYSRVKTDFGFPISDKNTDERLKAEDKSQDLGLIELIYNFGRYLIIASSREGSEATNLQGIWNEMFIPPWQANYTVNINTQMNYWPVLMCNLAGLDMPLVDLIKKISVTGMDTAKEFYRANGYCAHHNVDIWGHSSPVGLQRPRSTQWAFWNMSAGWLCRHLFEHYEYTLDKDFLRDTAYPLMKGAAEFYLSVMIKDGENYIVSPSTSPENSYKNAEGKRLVLAKYTAMTQAILTDLFTCISKSADILGIDDDFVKKVRQLLPAFNTYKIGSQGQLLEYDEEYEEFDIKHRHTSHLYGLYPGDEITVEGTPELADACRVTLDRRGDLSTGWAMGWRVCFWAKLKDGNRALNILNNQLRFTDPKNRSTWKGGGSFLNLFCAHPPFQIDGNFGVCAGITLMFLQCEDSKIRILPALPDKFTDGSISGLKAKGNITVDIEWKNKKASRVTLESPYTQKVTLDVQGKEIKALLFANEKLVLEF